MGKMTYDNGARKFASKTFDEMKPSGFEYLKISVSAFEGTGRVYVHITNEKKNCKMSLNDEEFGALIQMKSAIRKSVQNGLEYIADRRWDKIADSEQARKESRYKIIDISKQDTLDICNADSEGESVKVTPKKKKLAKHKPTNRIASDDDEAETGRKGRTTKPKTKPSTTLITSDDETHSARQKKKRQHLDISAMCSDEDETLGHSSRKRLRSDSDPERE